jgi:hypothetical protein
MKPRVIDSSKPARARDEDIGRQLAPAYLPVGSHAERLAEIAEILAAGLTRLRSRQSSHLSADCGESSLDSSAHQSSHANALKTHGGLD